MHPFRLPFRRPYGPYRGIRKLLRHRFRPPFRRPYGHYTCLTKQLRRRFRPPFRRQYGPDSHELPGHIRLPRDNIGAVRWAMSWRWFSLHTTRIGPGKHICHLTDLQLSLKLLTLFEDNKNGTVRPEALSSSERPNTLSSFERPNL